MEYNKKEKLWKMKREYWLGALDLEEWHSCEFPVWFLVFVCLSYIWKGVTGDGEVYNMEPSIGTTPNSQETCSV